MLFRSSAAVTIPAELSPSLRVRWEFVAIRTIRPALVSRINRVRIVSRAIIPFPPSPSGSVIEGDADRRAQVVQLSAFLGVTGDVHFALGCAVTSQAGLDVILRDHNPECRPPIG